MKALCYLLFFIPFLFTLSCKKDTPLPQPKVNELQLSIQYNIDNVSYVTNINKYVNQAGNHFSISRVSYYLSQIKLIKSDNSSVLVKEYQYVDADNTSSNKLIFNSIPIGDYIGIKFNIGLDSLHNISDALPTTMENINMAWPQMMGGGYHFLKMEGNFLDSLGQSFGYAMHLGTNVCLIPIMLNKKFTVSADSKLSFNLVMNINEWYKNPNIFDFNKDGNYIMGNMMLMKKITENGIDVFTL